MILDLAPSELAGALLALLDRGMSAAPAFMAGLAILLIVPPLVAIGAIIGYANRRSHARRSPPVSEDDGPTRAWRAAPLQATLALADQPRTPITAERPLVRIGRQDDNDIRIDAETVHRYHALVHRGEDGLYWLSDVSGPGGNGVRVDGKRIDRCRLRGGETIDIGGTELKFEMRRDLAEV
ncbi:MAG: FHA domain-containing protein [Hyphomicrobiaceae bacterium]|jgi:pSer/pThr/pTyr-binding forkhead associated (FHA) protein